MSNTLAADESGERTSGCVAAAELRSQCCGVNAPRPSQQKAARIVGLAYLLALPLAIFPEAYVPSRLYVATWPDTAARIAAHLPLYRAGIVSTLLVFTVDIVLVCALYLALNPINHGVAGFAAAVRLIETALYFGVVVNDLGLARVISNSTDAATQTAAATTGIMMHSSIYGVGLFFAGLGSTIFALLWLKSRYVPRPLAVLGVVASAILAGRQFLWIVAPTAAANFGIAIYGGPIFIFELLMGLWLVTKGLSPAARDEAT